MENSPPKTHVDTVSAEDTLHSSFAESQPVQEAVVEAANPTIVAGHTELPAMCRDFLRVVYALNRAESDQSPTGRRITHRLETEYGVEIGAPYNRLDQLADRDLITKQHLTGKRKTYHVTPRGIRLLEDLAYFTSIHLSPLTPAPIDK